MGKKNRNVNGTQNMDQDLTAEELAQIDATAAAIGNTVTEVKYLADEDAEAIANGNPVMEAEMARLNGMNPAMMDRAKSEGSVVKTPTYKRVNLTPQGRENTTNHIVYENGLLLMSLPTGKGGRMMNFCFTPSEARVKDPKYAKNNAGMAESEIFFEEAEAGPEWYRINPKCGLDITKIVELKTNELNIALNRIIAKINRAEDKWAVADDLIESFKLYYCLKDSDVNLLLAKAGFTWTSISLPEVQG